MNPAGGVLFTRDDILGGQQVFLRNGLMEYGSIFGHGAYLGPDFTADYLRRAATSVLNSYGGAQSDQARGQTIQEFKTNRYDPATDTLAFTAGAVGRLCGTGRLLPGVLFRADDALWAAAERDQRSTGNQPVDRVFQLVGMDRRRVAARHTTIPTPTTGPRAAGGEYA